MIMWDADHPASDAKAYSPPMDIYEKGDQLFIEIELPGMQKEDIRVYTSRDLVIVEGAKQDRNLSGIGEDKRISFLQLERKLGKFRREIELPVACNTREAKAGYENGLLVVELIKIKERRGERIKIPVR